MNILIISSGKLPVPPVKGGAVENLIDLILQYNEQNNTNIQITVCSIYDKFAEKMCNQYKKTKFKFINTENFKYKISKIVMHFINKLSISYVGNVYINQIRKKLNFAEYDFVIIENCPEYANVIYKEAKGKLILHLHNDRLNKKTKNANKIFAMYEKIFVLSNYIGNEVKRIELGNANKVYTLYNGIDIQRFNNEKYRNQIEKIKKQFNINNQDKVILYTGRLVPEKGIKELIQAFKQIKCESCKLLIAGSVGYGKTSVSKYVEELKDITHDNKNIIFTGYISYEMIPRIYAIADIGVIPSIWEEPFALTVIEHMAAGHPVIVSNSGGITELINEDCAVVVKKEENFIQKLKEAIEDLVKDDEKRNNMSKAAILQANNFNKEKYCKTFFSLIKK